MNTYDEAYQPSRLAALGGQVATGMLGTTIVCAFFTGVVIVVHLLNFVGAALDDRQILAACVESTTYVDCPLLSQHSFLHMMGSHRLLYVPALLGTGAAFAGLALSRAVARADATSRLAHAKAQRVARFNRLMLLRNEAFTVEHLGLRLRLFNVGIERQCVIEVVDQSGLWRHERVVSLHHVWWAVTTDAAAVAFFIDRSETSFGSHIFLLIAQPPWWLRLWARH
jgi:hypothetical protein